MKICLSATFVLLIGFSAQIAGAVAVDYNTAGATYSQNFNTLSSVTSSNTAPYSPTSTWTNGTTLTGWHVQRDAGSTAASNNYPTSDGGGPRQGYVISLGALNSSDRALGSQNTDWTTGSPRLALTGVQLVNNTGVTLNQFTLNFTGEQWRLIVNEQADRMDFDYQVFAGSGSLTAVSGWTNVDQLDFIAPQASNTGSNRALDGEDGANRSVISYTVTGVNWTSGSELWLRWADINGAVNGTQSQRAILGIDDVSFTAAVPEPASVALLLMGCAFGGIGYAHRRIASRRVR